MTQFEKIYCSLMEHRLKLNSRMFKNFNSFCIVESLNLIKFVHIFEFQKFLLLFMID